MKTQKKSWLIIFGGLLSMLFIVGCSQSPPADTSAPLTSAPPVVAECTTKECFISSANDCKDLTLTLTEAAGVFTYSSKDCVFTKILTSLNADETHEMKALLQGKSLTCKYEKGKFDNRWANSLIFGTEYCEGELKDILSELILFV